MLSKSKETAQKIIKFNIAHVILVNMSEKKYGITNHVSLGHVVFIKLQPFRLLLDKWTN